MIAFTYLDKLGPALRVGSTARFVWARASRMWPVYALVFHLFGLWLVARLVFGSGGDIAYQSVQPIVSVGQWVQQLFMVQMWNNPFLDGASWVGPTWSLSAEWLAYLLFPLTALGFFRMRNLPVAVLAIGALALMTPIAWAYLSTGSPYYPWSWVVRVLCGFGAGVLAYLTVRRLRGGERLSLDLLGRRASGIAALVPLVIAAGLVLGEIAGPGRGGAVIVLFPVLVGALALADRGPAMVLARPLMVSGGRISFSLYLVHIPIFEVFWTALRHFPVAGRPACFVALSVLLSTLVVAGIAYHLVEEPARRRMRRIARPARAVAPTASAADAGPRWPSTWWPRPARPTVQVALPGSSRRCPAPQRRRSAARIGPARRSRPSAGARPTGRHSPSPSTARRRRAAPEPAELGSAARPPARWIIHTVRGGRSGAPGRDMMLARSPEVTWPFLFAGLGPHAVRPRLRDGARVSSRTRAPMACGPSPAWSGGGRSSCGPSPTQRDSAPATARWRRHGPRLHRVALPDDGGGQRPQIAPTCGGCRVRRAAATAPIPSAPTRPAHRPTRRRALRHGLRLAPGPLADSLCGHQPLLELLSSLLSSVLEADAATTATERALEQARHEADTDVLTGLLNRRGWERLLRHEEERYRRFGDLASVVVLDLDRLKLVNDTHGHDAGDRHIRRAAESLMTVVRPGDLVARLGGDEFGIVAPRRRHRRRPALVERMERALTGAGVAGTFGHAPYSVVAGFPGALEGGGRGDVPAQARRPRSGDEHDLATCVTPDHERRRGRRLGQRVGGRHDHPKRARAGQLRHFGPRRGAQLGPGVGAGAAAERLDPGVGGPFERDDRGDAGSGPRPVPGTRRRPRRCRPCRARRSRRPGPGRECGRRARPRRRPARCRGPAARRAARRRRCRSRGRRGGSRAERPGGRPNRPRRAPGPCRRPSPRWRPAGARPSRRPPAGRLPPPSRARRASA